MEQTIAHINDGIENAARAIGGPRVRVSAHVLAEPTLLIRDGNEYIPAIISEHGEGLDIMSYFDTNEVVTYNRLTSKQYEVSVRGYGNGRNYNEICDLSLFVYGRRVINQYQLEKAIVGQISRENGCVVLSADFNASQILSSEYSGVTMNLSPEFFVFKINYRLTRAWNTGCVK